MINLCTDMKTKVLIDSKTKKPIKIPRRRFTPLREDSVIPHIPSTVVERNGKKYIDSHLVREAGRESAQRFMKVFGGQK